MIFRPLLTTAEKTVLRKTANGKNNTQIREELGLSQHALKNTIGALCTKLGAETPAQCVAIAFCTGILTPKMITGFNPEKDVA